MTTASIEDSFGARMVRRLPFFYGWVVVSISFLTVFMTGATSYWGVPVFVHPMSEATGWSHASIFGGLSLRFLFGATGGFAMGHFADKRKGPAMLLLFGTLIDAAALISLRWVHSSTEFLLVYGVVGGIASTGTRLVPSTLVAKWFVARRGRAVGFSTNGGGVSALIMVPVIALLISQFGWRGAWTGLAIIELVVLLPLVPLAIRQPEDVGLLPDNGYVPDAGSRTSKIAASERSWTLGEVVKTWQFWILVVGVLFGNYSLQTHTVVMVPYFEDIGFSSGTAASALSVYGLCSIGMRFAWGTLADRQGVRVAIITQSLLTAIGAVLLLQVGGIVSLYIIIAYQGLTMSGFPPLQILVWPAFYGRMHIGSIVGMTQFFSTIAGAAGPLIEGFLFDRTGSYDSTLVMLIVTWAGCAAIMLALRPKRYVDTDSAVAAAAT